MSRFVRIVEEADVTYEDLIADLVRYGGGASTESEWRRKFPAISDDLIVAVASSADECPACLGRFIYLGPRAHRTGCGLAEVLGNGPAVGPAAEGMLR